MSKQNNNQKPMVSKDDAKKIYHEMRTTTPESIKAITDEAKRQSTELFSRAAKECSEADFVEALVEGDLPPIKLNADEQELLKGGITPLVLITILSLCSLIGATGIAKTDGGTSGTRK